MTIHAVTIPTEPRDRTVVLDSEGHAWQRSDDTWWCVGRYEQRPGHVLGVSQVRRTWPHLIVDYGPIHELGPIPTVGRPVRDNPQA